MSTLYNQRGIWYLDTTINNRRIRRSLHTSNKSTAKKLAKSVEHEIISNVLIGRKPISVPNTPLKQLIKAFLEDNHDWSLSTQQIYRPRARSGRRNRVHGRDARCRRSRTMGSAPGNRADG